MSDLKPVSQKLQVEFLPECYSFVPPSPYVKKSPWCYPLTRKGSMCQAWKAPFFLICRTAFINNTFAARRHSTTLALKCVPAVADFFISTCKDKIIEKEVHVWTWTEWLFLSQLSPVLIEVSDLQHSYSPLDRNPVYYKRKALCECLSLCLR